MLSQSHLSGDMQLLVDSSCSSTESRINDDNDVKQSRLIYTQDSSCSSIESRIDDDINTNENSISFQSNGYPPTLNISSDSDVTAPHNEEPDYNRMNCSLFSHSEPITQKSCSSTESQINDDTRTKENLISSQSNGHPLTLNISSDSDGTAPHNGEPGPIRTQNCYKDLSSCSSTDSQTKDDIEEDIQDSVNFRPPAEVPLSEPYNLCF